MPLLDQCLHLMDTYKRAALIQSLAELPEPQVVQIDRFFDGNDDEGSIGCNLSEHPGIEAFRAVFRRIAMRDDVQAIYARITELDPGSDCWPFVDTVFFVGRISMDDLSSELANLDPSDIGPGEDYGIPEGIPRDPETQVLAAWWD